MIGGRFTLGRPIGRGGMGTVHEAYDEHLHRRIALKQVTTPDEASLRRFRREARLMARLNHPGVPAVFDVGDDYIAMEFVAGQRLRDLIAEAAPLPGTWVAAIGLQVVAVLACAHRVGLVHRDLTPSNILLTPAGAVKVVDFGVATLVGDESLSTLTPPGVVVGTAGYQAPERQFGVCGPRSDLYSLGCLLSELGGGFAETTVDSLTAADPTDRPSSATAVVPILRSMLGTLAPIPGFVPDPQDVLGFTDAYLALARQPVGTNARGLTLPVRQARAEAERLVAVERYEEAIALLDAALSATPQDASALDAFRDLVRALFEYGDIGRAVAESELLVRQLSDQLGSHHPATLQALAWQVSALAQVGDLDRARISLDELRAVRADVDALVPTQVTALIERTGRGIDSHSRRP